MAPHIRPGHYKMPVGQGCDRIQPLVHGLVFGIYQVYTGIYLVYSWNDISFSVPAANPFSSRFVCPSHWHVFGEWNVDLGEWDPALLLNTSHRVEYTRRKYYLYSMYIHCISQPYPLYITNIYKVYSMYIQSICMEYT